MAVLNDEQKLLIDAAGAWARERSPILAWRRLRNNDGGYDPAIFAEMAEMGWAGIVTPEEYGGADFGFLSMGLVLEQIGRTLTASPLAVSSLAAATGIKLAGTAAQKQEWLPAIARGEAVVAIACDEAPRHDPRAIKLKAEKTRGGYVLSGEKRPVLHGIAADAAIVVARTSGTPGDRDGVTLLIVPSNAANLRRSELHEVERRGAAVFAFDNVEVGQGAVLGEADRGAEVLGVILDAAAAGVAAEMLGAAHEAFDITLAYLKTRVQFGRLIGEFQALQHRAAALHGELVLTRSAVEAALAALDDNAPGTSELVSLAKALAGDAFRRVACEMVQMHGGIGMTEEHDAGLFLKRARTSDMNFGTSAYHRERYAELIGC